MLIPICEHVKMDGVRCGSPALRRQRYCYYHVGAHRLVPRTNFSGRTTTIRSEGPAQSWLEETWSIQTGFSEIIYAITHDRIGCRTAKLLLSALHHAVAGEFSSAGYGQAPDAKRVRVTSGDSGLA